MTEYYVDISHTNSSDLEEDVYTLKSTVEEPKTAISLIIFNWSNKGYLRIYHEREKVAELLIGDGTLSNPYELPLNVDLDVGEELKITLTNYTSGTNAGITAALKYHIK